MAQQGRDEAGNIWNLDAQGNPTTLAQPARARPILTVAPPAYRVQQQQREEGRKDDDQSIQRHRLANEDARLQADQSNDPIQRRILLAQATQAEAKAKEATLASIPIDPSMDKLTGADYAKRLPSEVAAQANALLAGRMAFPSGAALKSPYWQTMLQHVAHIDPNFDAVNYNARASTRRDYVSGKSAQNIRALNTAIGHLGQLNSQISGTASHGGLPGATIVNQIENALSRSAGSPGVTKYEQTAGAVASELTQVFRGSGGAEADIQREIEHLSPNASYAQKKASVQNIASLLKSRLDALGDQYTQGMGTTAEPLHLLNSHADTAYQALSKIDPNLGASSTGGGGPGGGGGDGPIPDTMHAFTLNNMIDFAAGITGGKYGFNDQRQLTYNGKAVDASAEVLNSEPYQKAYRARFGEDPGLTVDVVGGSPAAKSELEQRRDTFGGGVDAVIRGAADTASLGLADPLAALMRSTFNDDGFAANLKRERAVSAADEEVNPYLRFGGQLVGAIPTFSAASRLGAAAVPSRPFVGTAMTDTAAGAIYGGASNMETSPVAGALVGSATALVGNQIGQRVLSPLIQRAMTPKDANSAIVRALVRPSRDLDTAQVRATLSDAERLNLPMSLADADPKLRIVAGSATRLAPAGREYAERVIEPRGRGQAERAIAGIQRDFGPTVNIDEAADGLINKGRTAAGSLYDEAYAAPVVATPELDAILATPAGRQALSRAHTIAANERRDPAALGFRMDADGNVELNPVRLDPFQAQAEAKSAFDAAQESHRVALRTAGANTETTRESLLAARDQMKAADAVLANAPTPGTAATSRSYTTQTLDYVKRGLDDILEQSRDPVTRRLHLDEAGRAVNDVRASLVKEVDNLNPRYAEARAAYEGPAKERDALLAGRGAVGPQTTPDRLGRMTNGRTDGQMDQLRTGFRTGMAENVDRMRFSGNPYDAIYGTPDQVAKVGALFPDGADNFARQADLERMMAKTQQETLGGSPTAGRRAADEMFAPGMGVQLAGETALGALAGVPPIGAVSRALTSTVRDRFRMGIGGSKKAESIAQLLLDPSPRAAMDTVDAIIAQQEARARALAIGGSAGAASFVPMLSPFGAE